LAGGPHSFLARLLLRLNRKKEYHFIEQKATSSTMRGSLVERKDWVSSLSRELKHRLRSSGHQKAGEKKAKRRPVLTRKPLEGTNQVRENVILKDDRSVTREHH